MLLSFFVIWPLLQAIVTRTTFLFDNKFFTPDTFILRSRKWEQEGKFYKKVFKVHKWKRLLPDGARIHKNGFRKKNLKSFENGYLQDFITQTGKSEVAHWLQILPFWVFGFWCPPFIIWFMLLYALLVNLPCIIAQRYNRPRLIKIAEIQSKKSGMKTKK